MLTPKETVPQSYGMSSGRMTLRRRISAGSRPSRSAARSIRRSRTKLLSGRPGERRAHRRLVGHHGPEIAGIVGHPVGTGQQRGELRRHQPGRTNVCLDVGVDHVADGADPPVPLEGHLDRVLHLTGVIGRRQALDDSRSTARAGPPAGCERDEDVLGVQLAADPEPPAHIHLGECSAPGVFQNGGQDVRLMWMHFVEPSRWSSPPRGSGGTATSPRVSSAQAVWRGARSAHATPGRTAKGQSASPTRMRITATLLVPVSTNKRGASAASAAATVAATGKGS